MLRFERPQPHRSHRDRDFFNVCAYDHTQMYWQPQLMQASQANIQAAIQWVSGQVS